MKPLFSLFFALLISLVSFGQANQTTTGNWDNASLWASNNIGDVVTETVSLSANITSTILNGETYTIGDFTLNQNNSLYVNAGGTLNVGDATHAATFITNQNSQLYIDGNFTIYGAVSMPQNITIIINGTLTIKGGLTLGQNANIQINSSGKLIINGDFTATQNTNVNITGSGQALVNGSINVAHGSNLNTPTNGFQYGGTCSDGNSNFCSNATYNGALPITLLYFNATQVENEIKLTWATASEINFNYFSIEKADTSALQFREIGRVNGSGTKNSLTKYEFTDNKTLGKNYYRLKSIDYDGKFDQSNVILISVDGAKSFTVYPNPVKGDLNLITNFNPSQDDRIVIYNFAGNVVHTGTPTTFINPSLSQGIYLVKYVSPTYQATVKIIVE